MGQTIISAGLVIIVTIAVINANRLVMTSETAKMEGLARMKSIDIALEFLTEVRLKKFDQNDTSATYLNQNSFTSSSSLGAETSERFTLPDTLPYRSATRYNDIDDYNGYRRTVNSSDISGFVLSATVHYATQSSPDNITTSKEYVKTVKVQVTHPTYMVVPTKFALTKTY